MVNTDNIGTGAWNQNSINRRRNSNRCSIAKTVGICALTAVAAFGLVKSFERKPFAMSNAVYNGVFPNSGDYVRMASFDEAGMHVKDKNFDVLAAHVEDRYNISGFSNAWGRYATNITPSGVESQ